MSCKIYSPGNKGSRSCKIYSPGNKGSRSCKIYSPGNKGSRSCKIYSPGNKGSRSCKIYSPGNGKTQVSKIRLIFKNSMLKKLAFNTSYTIFILTDDFNQNDVNFMKNNCNPPQAIKPVSAVQTYI